MTLRAVALTAVLLASACSRQAPVENTSFGQAAQSPQPAPANIQPANTAAPSAEKPSPHASVEPGKSGDETQAAADDDDDADPADDPAPAPRRGRGCAAETSLGAAEELVRVCTEVSPATHPPCNVQNSCAEIRREISRSCRLLGNDAPEDCRGG